jgi:hypothetical protein
MDKNWLPEGHHWGLRIEHRRLPDAGPFTGGGHKLIWHTTEGGASTRCGGCCGTRTPRRTSSSTPAEETPRSTSASP